MQTRISEELNTILGYSTEEALRTGCLAITADHILLGILRHADNDACRTLSAMGIDLQDLKNTVESQLFKPQGIPYSQRDSVSLGRNGQNTLNLSAVEASIAGADHIGTSHMLLAISRAADSHTHAYFKSLGIDRASLCTYMLSHSMLKPTIVKTSGAEAPKVQIIEIPSNPDRILS